MAKAIWRIRRAWQTVLAWERAMDYSAHDYALERVGALERELSELKSEVNGLRVDRSARVRAINP